MTGWLLSDVLMLNACMAVSVSLGSDPGSASKSGPLAVLTLAEKYGFFTFPPLPNSPKSRILTGPTYCATPNNLYIYLKGVYLSL